MALPEIKFSPPLLNLESGVSKSAPWPVRRPPFLNVEFRIPRAVPCVATASLDS